MIELALYVETLHQKRAVAYDSNGLLCAGGLECRRVLELERPRFQSLCDLESRTTRLDERVRRLGGRLRERELGELVGAPGLCRDRCQHQVSGTFWPSRDSDLDLQCHAIRAEPGGGCWPLVGHQAGTSRRLLEIRRPWALFNLLRPGRNAWPLLREHTDRQRDASQRFADGLELGNGGDRLQRG